jgi:hypothetical protein
MAGAAEAGEQRAQDRQARRGGEGEDGIRFGDPEAVPGRGGEEGEIGEQASGGGAPEGQAGRAEDGSRGRAGPVGLGVRACAADGRDGAAPGRQLAGDVGEQLAGGGRVGPEELVQQEDAHGGGE